VNDNRIYTVVVRSTTTGELVFRALLVCLILIGGSGISHLYWGGSWIIDIMLVITMLAVTSGVSQHSEREARMTPDQLRNWVLDGMPDDWGRH